MPSNLKTFLVRRKDGSPLEMVRIAERAVLLGVEGFAFHRLGDDRSVWRLSHIETGALCGRGRTKALALDHAIEKAETRANVLAKIAKMRGVVRKVAA